MTAVFGLTGGIASGKSSASARLRARGVPVLDADLMAREAVAPGTPGLADLVRAFGRLILASDGSMDRKAVGLLVFHDSAARTLLNSIVHPRIRAIASERIASLSASGEPLACYDAALLVESGSHSLYRPLVVVSAPEELQVARVMSRDCLPREEALVRVRSQLPLSKKVEVADFVVENSGTLEELHSAVDSVLDSVCEVLGVDSASYPRR